MVVSLNSNAEVRGFHDVGHPLSEGPGKEQRKREPSLRAG
jgi:hypothetical protein